MSSLGRSALLVTETWPNEDFPIPTPSQMMISV
jgi:hypothetical protein